MDRILFILSILSSGRRREPSAASQNTSQVNTYSVLLSDAFRPAPS